MRNISDKIAERESKHSFIFYEFFSENRTIYKTMLNNMVESDRPQTKIRRMRFACRIPKASNTHSEYLTLIDFPLPQQLRERASVLLLYLH